MAAEKASLRLGIAQIETTLGDVGANLHKHRDWIERAHDAAADVLLFPELSLTGYSLRGGARDVAMSISSAPVHELARAAGAMLVTFGFVEFGDDGLFNAAVAVRDGRIQSVHRKINLPGYGRLEEDRWFTSGDNVGSFALTPGWTAASLICADVWNPALVHIAACRGADLLLVPVSSAIEAIQGFDNPGGWKTTLDFYAMMYGLPVLMTNRVGREGDLTFWGGSRVLDACGRTIARAADDEALVVAEIARSDIKEARDRLPTVRDSKPALVQAELARWLESRLSTNRVMSP